MSDDIADNVSVDEVAVDAALSVENGGEVSQPEAETQSVAAEPEDYSFGATDGDAAAGGSDAAADGDGELYSVEWPEGFAPNEELTEMVNAAAREAGVSDRALGAYTARMIEVLTERQAEVERADDAALKELWGREYRANKAAARDFMGRVMVEQGLSEEDVKVFANAKGFKVLYALSRKVGGGDVHLGTVSAGEQAWARAAMGDVAHPDNKALRDPRDPRHREVTMRYFRAMGARG